MNTSPALIASTALSSLLFVAVAIFAGILYSKYDKLESLNSLISAMKGQPQTSVEQPQQVTFAPASVEVKPTGGISLAVDSLNLAPIEFKDLQISPTSVNFNVQTLEVKPVAMTFSGALPAAPQSPPPFLLSRISFHRMYSLLNATSTTKDLAEILSNFDKSRKADTFVNLHHGITRSPCSKALAHDFLDYAAALREESPGETPPLIKALNYSSLSNLHQVRADSFAHEILERSPINEITTKLDNYRRNNNFTAIRDLVDECVENEISNVLRDFFNELYLASFYASKVEEQLTTLGIVSTSYKEFFEYNYMPLKLRYVGNLVAQELQHNLSIEKEIFCINFDSLGENLKKNFIKLSIANRFCSFFYEPGRTIESFIISFKNYQKDSERMWEFIKNLLDESNQFQFIEKRNSDNNTLDDLKLDYKVPIEDSIKENEYWDRFNASMEETKETYLPTTGNKPKDYNYTLLKELDFRVFLNVIQNRNLDKAEAYASEFLDYDFN
jgi:hypothetical protein